MPTTVLHRVPPGGAAVCEGRLGLTCSSVWTGSAPGGSGYFWYRDLPYEPGDLVLVQDGIVYAPGVAVPVPLSAMFGWWAGPVLPPIGSVRC